MHYQPYSDTSIRKLTQYSLQHLGVFLISDKNINTNITSTVKISLYTICDVKMLSRFSHNQLKI